MTEYRERDENDDAASCPMRCSTLVEICERVRDRAYIAKSIDHEYVLIEKDAEVIANAWLAEHESIVEKAKTRQGVSQLLRGLHYRMVAVAVAMNDLDDAEAKRHAGELCNGAAIAWQWAASLDA